MRRPGSRDRAKGDPVLRDRSHSGIPTADILHASATMVGVCVTVIGLFRALGRSRETYADDVLAADALLFLVSTASSYFGLRFSSESRRRAFEAIADATFLLALTVMVVVCGLLAYALG